MFSIFLGTYQSQDTKYYLALQSETFQINTTHMKVLLQTTTYCALIIHRVTLFILKYLLWRIQEGTQSYFSRPEQKAYLPRVGSRLDPAWWRYLIIIMPSIASLQLGRVDQDTTMPAEHWKCTLILCSALPVLLLIYLVYTITSY